MEPGSMYNTSDALPKMGQLLLENEKVQRKLLKVQQRRDHYAKLYYKTLAELDETKWELSIAKDKIKRLEGKFDYGGQAPGHSHSNTTSPDSGTSLSPAVAQVPSHSFTLPRVGSKETHRPVEVAAKPSNVVRHSWREHSTRPFKLGLPKPNFHKPPTFSRSYSLSQGDGIRDSVSSASTLSQDVQTPPVFSRRMSLPYNGLNSQTLSAFQPPVRGYKHVPHLVAGRRSPSECSRFSVATSSTSQSSCPEEAYYQCLPGVQMLDVLTHLSSSQCIIKKLEIANSHLGEPEAMQVFCKDLIKNRSVTSLSLPENDIGPEALCVLLDSVRQCSLIKELLLRNNKIGVDCVKLIKRFLSETTLDSLVLTGNEIEQYSHMLSDDLPHDFSMEYSGSGDGSVDSGVAREHSDISSSFKYLHI